MTAKEYVSIDNNEHIADDFTEYNIINDMNHNRFY
jgi:hypothetical protein